MPEMCANADVLGHCGRRGGRFGNHLRHNDQPLRGGADGMRWIAGDECQLSVLGGTQNGKVCRLDNPPSSHHVMKQLASAQNVDIVAIAETVNVAEKCVAMPGNDRVPNASRNGGFREMRRTQQKRMARRPLEHDVFEVNSGNGQFSQRWIGRDVLAPSPEKDFLLRVHPEICPKNISAEHRADKDQHIRSHLSRIAETRNYVLWIYATGEGPPQIRFEHELRAS